MLRLGRYISSKPKETSEWKSPLHRGIWAQERHERQGCRLRAKIQVPVAWRTEKQEAGCLKWKIPGYRWHGTSGSPLIEPKACTQVKSEERLVPKPKGEINWHKNTWILRGSSSGPKLKIGDHLNSSREENRCGQVGTAEISVSCWDLTLLPSHIMRHLIRKYFPHKKLPSSSQSSLCYIFINNTTHLSIHHLFIYSAVVNSLSSYYTSGTMWGWKVEQWLKKPSGKSLWYWLAGPGLRFMGGESRCSINI